MLGTIIGVGGALALGSIISGIAGIGLALKALVFLKPLLVLGGLIAAGYAISRIFPNRPQMDKDPNAVVNQFDYTQSFTDKDNFQQKAKNLARENLEAAGGSGIGIPGLNKGFNPFNPFPINQLIKEKNKKPKVTEITLPIQELNNKKQSQQNVSLPETTEVPYVTSINAQNEYMEKTPEIHGIKL